MSPHKQSTPPRHLLMLALSTLALLVSAPAARAATWSQYDNWGGELDNNYSASVVGNVAEITFLNQVATNYGASAQHLGMVFGWSWVRPAGGPNTNYQALDWDNITQRFTNGVISMQVQHLGHGDQFLRHGDVQGATWLNVPWSPEPGVVSDIALDPDWVAPLFDFGVVGAGQDVSYDIRFRVTFADNATAQQYVDLGGLHSYALGVAQQVPAPASLALVGLAMLAGVGTRRRKAG